ncbi:MAG: N-acetyl-gamma-glutamyl-phosphate reductase [Nitrospiraceae bacterium]|nr:N-acetyl-gamma-glutamyl-phosphate reductase [Nitrospiraceae bacterium]
MRVVVFGASGYAGAELVRIIATHPHFELVGASAGSNAGAEIGAIYPHLAHSPYGGMRLQSNDELAASLDAIGAELAFFALPHNQAAGLVPKLLGSLRLVVDLSADFRLVDPGLYESVYGFVHPAPELLEEAVYGLVELKRAELSRARLIAAPGCYVTAVTLALFPFIDRGLVAPGSVPVANAVSGVSGAGRSAKLANLFGEIDSDVSAYGLSGHRHRPEIEQNLGSPVLFVPHLVPMTRGILATCYFDIAPAALEAAGLDGSSRMLIQEMLHAELVEFYDGAAFVSVLDAGNSPHTKATLGTNMAIVSVSYDPASGKAVVLSALDNMVKGASGQAVQAANVALGLPEAAGLTRVSVYP